MSIRDSTVEAESPWTRVSGDVTWAGAEMVHSSTALTPVGVKGHPGVVFVG